MAQSPISPPQGDGDPSMDDILASIRRILSDEEKATKSQRADDGVLMLDPSMMIEEPMPPEPHALSHEPHADEPHTMTDEPEPHPAPLPPDHEPPRTSSQLMIAGDEAPPPPAAPVHQAEPRPNLRPDPATLVAPEAAAMAASSVGALMRTLVAERSSVVHRGGPSIEDLVREEMRPLLKQWLDIHLPPLVERLVRAEIERVVGRIGT